MQAEWDVIVVGGGAAGLSAALVLGRARRRTLVVDAGAPSNAPAHGIGGLLGHDGRPPAELYAIGRGELARYPSVEVRSGTVGDGERREDGFVLSTDAGEQTARAVVLATGMEYRVPPLDGVEGLWGRSVFHCPFCHGWEVREQPLAVLDAGPGGVHRALLLTAWSDDVVLLGATPGEDDAARLRAAGVRVDERPVRGVRGRGDALEAVLFADGDELPRAGMLVGVTLHQRSDLAARLGAAIAAPNPMFADAPVVDARGQTSVPGLYAGGDLTGAPPSVAAAVASGAMAAATAVGGLVGAI